MKLAFHQLVIAVLVVFLQFGSSASAQDDGFAKESYGPFDYSLPEHRAKYLPVVDSNHFNSDVANLVKGMTGTIWGDLDYCLRIFPNHHKALNAMARLYRRDSRPSGAPADRPLSYYFERAYSLTPRDSVPHQLAGIHYHLMKDFDKAEQEYLKAQELNPDNAELHYNLGLLYAAMKDYDKARHHAEITYQMGYPLPGLRNKLRRDGAWE